MKFFKLVLFALFFAPLSVKAVGISVTPSTVDLLYPDIVKEKITVKNPLADIMQKCKIGQETSFKILRDKKEIILKAKLEEKDTN